MKKEDLVIKLDEWINELKYEEKSKRIMRLKKEAERIKIAFSKKEEGKYPADIAILLHTLTISTKIAESLYGEPGAAAATILSAARSEKSYFIDNSRHP